MPDPYKTTARVRRDLRRTIAEQREMREKLAQTKKVGEPRRRKKVAKLRDLSNKRVVSSNVSVEEIVDPTDDTSATTLMGDITANTLPPIREAISTLLQKINELTDRVNEVT
jgi:hypothetical protein